MTQDTSKRLAAVGLSLQLALVLGIAATLAGVMGTFLSIGADEDIAAAAGSITGGVAHALRWMTITSPVALVGLVILAFATSDGGARERWVYRGSFAAFCVWCLLFPVGTIIGVTGLCLLISRRKEFKKQGEPGVRDNLVSAPSSREA